LGIRFNVTCEAIKKPLAIAGFTGCFQVVPTSGFHGDLARGYPSYSQAVAVSLNALLVSFKATAGTLPPAGWPVSESGLRYAISPPYSSLR